MNQQGRRRIDRIAAPDFLDGIEERSAEEVRRMREECREEEELLSYKRRMLQGRIDILRAEVERRRSGGDGALLDSLPSILADSPSRSAQPHARRSPVYAPGDTPGRRADDSVEGTLAQLLDLDDDRLQAELDRLVSDERAISDLRRRVLDRLDRLQVEVASRLQDGSLDADSILRASGWATGATGADDQR